MKSQFKITVLLLALSVNPAANAASDKTWADISDVGVYTLVGSALILPAVRDDWTGVRQAVYSMGAAEGVSLLGKAVVHERRPDNSDNNSFPSGHSAVAFASATTIYRRYGWEIGLPAYALATLTASARVAANKHHWYDAVAGAAIGGASGWYFTDAFDNKVQFVPWADSKGVGFEASMAW
ncbi:MAG: phosphatase PAP2 family protein [Methylotenera sp.]|nr:phosphatase PAP2 family protein [Methylotenera sp.]